MTCTYTWEAETGGLPAAGGQPGLHRKSQVTQGLQCEILCINKLKISRTLTANELLRTTLLFESVDSMTEVEIPNQVVLNGRAPRNLRKKLPQLIGFCFASFLSQNITFLQLISYLNLTQFEDYQQLTSSAHSERHCSAHSVFRTHFNSPRNRPMR